MNKIQKERLLKPLLDIYEEIELDLLRDILMRIDNYSDVKGTFKWYTDKLIELGLLEQESLKKFNNKRKEIKKTIEQLFKNVNHLDDLDRIASYYNDDKIKVNPEEAFKSSSINSVVNNAISDSISIMDLIQTKAIEGVKETYKDVLNTAYVETASGIYTYTESIKRALKKYTEKGITAAHYESGKSLSIESVVRRDVITRVNKLNADIIIEQCKALETNLVYVDQHLGARTKTKYMKHSYEAHADWQGRKYMIDGSSVKYPNLYEATGLGEMLGLYGINCYHNMRPTWEWEKIKEQIEELENAKAYELFQKQRTYERKLRTLKREKEIAKVLNDTEELNSVKEKYRDINVKYDKWLDDNKLTRDYNREYVASNTSIPTFKKEYFEEYETLDKSKEHLIIYNKETGKRVGNICTGTDKRVKPDFKTLYKLVTAKRESLIVTHNHPRNTSFSLQDFKTFNNTTSIGILIVRTDDYIYAISGHKIKDLKFLEETHKKIKKTVQKENLNIIDERHKINVLFAKEMGWKYGRIENKKDN